MESRGWRSSWGGAKRTRGTRQSFTALTHRGDFAKEAEASGIRIVAFQKSVAPPPERFGPWSSVEERPAGRASYAQPPCTSLRRSRRQARGGSAIVNTRHGALVQIKEQGSGFVATTSSPDTKADLIYRACLRWTDAVVLISEATRNFYVEHRGCPSSKTHVILNGGSLGTISM